MRRMLLAALTAFVLASPVLADDGVTFVKDGKTDWSIAVPVNCSPPERLAAEEIARYVKQMSGADLPIRSQGSKSMVKQVVSVGADGQSSDDGYEIAVSDGLGISIHGKNSRSTLIAAYHFLDALGCRFLAPEFQHYNHSAEIVPRVTTLTAHSESGGNPTAALKFRKLYVEEGRSHTLDNLKQLVEWMPKVGYNTLVIPTNYQGHDKVKWDNWRSDLTRELLVRGITIEVGGHGYQNFVNASMDGGTLFQKHPEYFGQDVSGRRQSGEQFVFCTSNADAVGYLIGNFLGYVKDRPEIQIYDFWPPDGAKWCECEKCNAIGTPSDRQAILLGQVKAAVSKVRPDLRLEMIAYSSYVAPPEHATVDSSVLVDFCPINQSFNWSIDDAASERNAAYAKDSSAWRKKFAGDISIYSYYRKYAWDSLPVLVPHYMQRDLRWYATLPTQGVSTYSEPGDWFTYELNHYMLAALAWGPNCDVDAVIRKFASARYGASADAAIAAYATLEDVVRTSCSIPYTPRKSAADLQAAEKRLQAARDGVATAAASADGSVQYNLNRLGLTLDYAIGDLQLIQLVAAKDRVGAKACAHGLFQLISQHADDGTFVAGHLTESRLLSRVGAGVKG